MMKQNFELDSSGNIITNPVIGWTIADAASGMLVIVAIQYVQNPQQRQMGEWKQIQLVVTPEKCQELAQALTNAADRAIQQRSQSGPIH